MTYRRHLLQPKIIKALTNIGWLIRWAIQWFLVLATTAFKIKVAGSYPKNPTPPVRFTALLFSTHTPQGIPSGEISSLRQHHAVRKYVPMELNADNRSVISGAMCMGVGWCEQGLEVADGVAVLKPICSACLY